MRIFGTWLLVNPKVLNYGAPWPPKPKGRMKNGKRTYGGRAWRKWFGKKTQRQIDKQVVRNSRKGLS